jgi:hypothetical protein
MYLFMHNCPLPKRDLKTAMTDHVLTVHLGPGCIGHNGLFSISGLI